MYLYIPAPPLFDIIKNGRKREIMYGKNAWRVAQDVAGRIDD